MREAPAFWMVFDVESVGLHGDAFAVGWVVIDPDGVTHEAGAFHCAPGSARGLESDRKWVAQNVAITDPPSCATPADVRARFWKAWWEWKQRGAWLAADCAWPVEARFLAACIDDAAGREWSGPYPLVDVASVRVGAGLDPLATEARLPDEEPAHHPLTDARQSARLLLEALTARRARGAGEG